MSRQFNLVKLNTHPFNSRLFKKLKDSDMEFMVQFLRDSESLNDDEYMHKVNRLFIDQIKPKNHSEIWAILLQCK